jgi:hypothetical protein
MTQYFPKTLRTLYRGCRGCTFYRFTNNDAAVSNIERQRHKYVIPAMAHPFLHDRHFSAASSFQIGVSRGLRMAKRDAGLCFVAMAFDMQLTG